MKGITIILIGCLLFLGAEHLWDSFHESVISTAMMCNCGCCNIPDEPQDKEGPCDENHDCLPDCDCLHPLQVSALEYKLIELPTIVVQSYNYSHYMNSYTYEYSNNFLQPPRFA